MTMFPQGRERIRAIGLYTAVSIGGAAVGLIAGGMLSEWASWRWVLFVNVPIGAALIVLLARCCPRPTAQRGRFDLAGAFTSTLGMTALVYGFVHAASDGWADTDTIGSFAVGRGAARRLRARRVAGRVADHAAAVVRRPEPRRARTSPGCCWSPE